MLNKKPAHKKKKKAKQKPAWLRKEKTMKYEKAVENRKEIVKRLEALTGKKAVYTRMPRCAYEIGEFTVERDGTLVTSEVANQDIIKVLIEEGLIVSSDAGTEETGLPAEAATTEEPAQDEEPVQDEKIGAEEITELPALDMAEIDDMLERGKYALAAPLDIDISMPLKRHTAPTLINLLNMIYTWGPLMSKATGGFFRINKSLIEDLNAHDFYGADEVLAFLQNNQSVQGLSFERQGRIQFTGFHGVVSLRNSGVFARLAYLINKAALTSRHIAAREITEPNEKYAMRCWLVRLGMTGEDLKFDRVILLSHLSGNSAFRTDRDKEVWLSRRNKKKDIIGNRIASLLSSDVGTLRLAARA